MMVDGMGIIEPVPTMHFITVGKDQAVAVQVLAKWLEIALNKKIRGSKLRLRHPV
ncbi:MAG: hypothetical protein AB1815_03595 [Bacillota bacterium]